MTATSKKRKKPAPAESEPVRASAALSWDDVGEAAELYWPRIGRKVARQIAEWNDKLFDGALTPQPIVLGRTSGALGHWFPLLDPLADQLRGYEKPDQAYRPPQPVLVVRRRDILRAMMARLLHEQGRSRRTTGEAWCEFVIQTHERLTGQKIWCSSKIERRDDGPQTTADGIRLIVPTVIVREPRRSADIAPLSRRSQSTASPSTL